MNALTSFFFSHTHTTHTTHTQHTTTTHAAISRYLLLGSSELLGNPVGLLQNLGTGVRDFFYEPAQGLIRYSPLQFGTGLARGTLSLAVHSTTGVALWCSKLADNARWAIDQLYSRCVRPILLTGTRSGRLSSRSDRARASYRRLILEEIPGREGGSDRSDSSIVRSGISSRLTATSLLRGMWSYVIFLVHPAALPIVFLRQTLGIIASVGPAIAALMETETSTALSLDDKSKMRRVRPPRFFTRAGPHHVLRMYNVGTSAGEEVLARVSKGKFRGEGYRWHVMLSSSSSLSSFTDVHSSRRGRGETTEDDDWVLVSTSHRIILVFRFELVWQTPWKDLLGDTVTMLTLEEASGEERERADDKEQLSIEEEEEEEEERSGGRAAREATRGERNASSLNYVTNAASSVESSTQSPHNNEEVYSRRRRHRRPASVSFLHMPRTRYGEEGGSYGDDERGGGGHGGMSMLRMSMSSAEKSSAMDGLASTMSFMRREIRCESRSCARRVVRLLKRGLRESSKGGERGGGRGLGRDGGLGGGRLSTSNGSSSVQLQRAVDEMSFGESKSDGGRRDEEKELEKKKDQDLETGRLPTFDFSSEFSSEFSALPTTPSRDREHVAESPGGTSISPARPG